MTTFRWGILGAARIARALIPAIRASGGEVVALGVRDPASDRAQAFAQEWGLPLVGGYQNVIQADVDAVYNPLPNDLHLPWTLAALRAGKHALTEKPLTLNAAEAAQLAEAAQQTGGTLLEAFAYRFQPHVTRLRDLARSGELGEIRAVTATFGFHMTNPDDFRWTAAKGGGALYDVGTYPVNLTRLLLGEPQAVTAQARWTESGPTRGVDAGLSGLLRYPHALATVSCAFDWTEPSTQRLTLTGTRGTVDVEGVFHSHTQESTHLRITDSRGARTEAFPAFNAYAAMVTHFQRAARGEETPLYPPTDAVAHAQVLDALLEAARNGNEVQIQRG